MISVFKPLRFGVREKLVLILFIIMATSMAAVGIPLLQTQEQIALAEIDRRGNDVAQLLSGHLAHSVVGNDYRAVDLALQELMRGHDILYVRVDNRLGQIMAVSGSLPEQSGGTRLYNEEIRLNGETHGRLSLVYSAEHITNALAARQQALYAWLAGAILFVAASIYTGLSLLVVRPLTIIDRGLRRNLSEDIATLESIPIPSTDDFGELARGLNLLAERQNGIRKILEKHFLDANLELREAREQLAAQAEMLRVRNTELEQLSITDPLTGLFNRRYFEHLMENEVAQAIRNDQTISILLIDIDHFRLINEQTGYNEGNKVIRNIARVISERVRKTDVACRYGGDEFFVLCRRATIANALSVADGLLQALVDTPIFASDHETRVTVSIGMATIPGVHDVRSAADFFQCASSALRYCKQSGRNAAMHYSMIERNIRAVTSR